MALNKKIELDSGVITNYHRIVSITKVINEINCIEIASYTSKEKRDEEKEKILQGKETGEAVPMDIFINTTFINKEYDENDKIEEVYKYLKNDENSMLKNAKDC